jgi:hypothetical protein
MAIEEQELQVIIQKEESQVINNPLKTTPEPSPTTKEGSEEHIKEVDSLNKIITTQTKLSDVKNSLGSIVDTMADNPSLFTRAATIWGELPLWQKILGGIVLSGPTVVAGLFAHISVLLVIGGVTGVVYTGSALILDDHHNCNVSIVERLKAGIFSLADILQLTIDALDKIRQELANEIDRFKLENFRLSENVSDLGTKVDSLSTQVVLFAETEKLLEADRKRLEQTSLTLKETVGENSFLLEKTHKELVQVKSEYQQSQQQLCAKVVELQEVRSSMELEVEKAKQVGSILNGTVVNLSKTVLTDKTQRQEFQAKLETFVTDEKASFHQVAERICKAEEELDIVKEQLKQSNDRYQKLLTRHEDQVIRLEKMGIENIKTRVNTTGLKQHGFHKKPLAAINENLKAQGAVLVM